jgi:RNA polymerase sigma factor (sigma-70 family)
VTPPPDDTDAALRSLLEKYGALIRRVVSRVGGRTLANKQDDVAQAVALSLWQQVSREQTITHPSSYVYRAAIRETVRTVEKELNRIRLETSLDADEAPAVASTALDPEAAAAAAEVSAHIEGAVSRLPAERQHAVRAHLAGYSVEEIMQIYGWPYQKARNLIARGMADLRADLAKGGYGG